MSDFLHGFGKAFLHGKRKNQKYPSTMREKEEVGGGVPVPDEVSHNVNSYPPSLEQSNEPHGHLMNPSSEAHHREYVNPLDIHKNITDRLLDIEKTHLLVDEGEFRRKLDGVVEKSLNDKLVGFNSDLEKYNGAFESTEELMNQAFLGLGDKGVEDLISFIDHFMKAYGSYNTSEMMKWGDKICYTVIALLPMYGARKKNFEARLKIYTDIVNTLLYEHGVLVDKHASVCVSAEKMKDELSFKVQCEEKDLIIDKLYRAGGVLKTDGLSRDEVIRDLMKSQKKTMDYILKTEAVEEKFEKAVGKDDEPNDESYDDDGDEGEGESAEEAAKSGTLDKR